MTNPTCIITIRIYVKEMVAFFKDNPKYGSDKENPYPADSFYELISPSSTFYGSLRNIMVFRNDCIYRWVLESADGVPLKFSKGIDDYVMDMEMIVEPKPTKDKWKNMFVFEGEPDVGSDGKLKVKNKKTNEDVVELETSSDVTIGRPIKYSFLFEFQDQNSMTKYGKIDPIANQYPPPDWP